MFNNKELQQQLAKSENLNRQLGSGLGATLGGLTGRALGKKRDQREKERYGLDTNIGSRAGTIGGASLGALAGNVLQKKYLGKTAAIKKLGMEKLAKDLPKIKKWDKPKKPKQPNFSKNDIKSKPNTTPGETNATNSGVNKTAKLNDLEKTLLLARQGVKGNDLSRDLKREGFPSALFRQTNRSSR